MRILAASRRTQFYSPTGWTMRRRTPVIGHTRLTLNPGCGAINRRPTQPFGIARLARFSCRSVSSEIFRDRSSDISEMSYCITCFFSGHVHATRCFGNSLSRGAAPWDAQSQSYRSKIDGNQNWRFSRSGTPFRGVVGSTRFLCFRKFLVGGAKWIGSKKKHRAG